MKPHTANAVEQLRHALVTNDDQTLLLLFQRWQKLSGLKQLKLPPHATAADIRRTLLAATPSQLIIFGTGRALTLVGGPLPGRGMGDHPSVLRQLVELCSLPEAQIEQLIAEAEQREELEREEQRQREQERLELQRQEQARQQALRQAGVEGRARCVAGESVTSAGGHELRYDAEARRFSCGRCGKGWGRIPRWTTACPGPPLGELCTKTALTRDYQLNKRWIARLGPPDRIRRRPRDYYTIELHLYEIARVERFLEQHRAEYDAYLAARARRRKAPLPQASEGENEAPSPQPSPLSAWRGLG